LAFLTEDYGLGGYFPSYDDSLRFSLNYYTGSRYPLFVGCFRGFCLYAGTYSGSYRDSVFYLRDHVRIVDTIRSRISAVQEWAALSRFFYSGNLLMGFEVGLVREIYSSMLRSYNYVFPDNLLSLGNERKGMLFGAVVGYGRGDVKGYFTFRYRNITRDSSVSSGDTTGWIITVPTPPKTDVEALLRLSWRGLSLNLWRRDRWGVHLRAEGSLRNLPAEATVGYVRDVGPVGSFGFGVVLRGLKVMVGMGYVEAPTFAVGLKYPVL